MSVNLTDKMIQGVKTDDGKRLELRDKRISGLILRVTPAGSKSFSFQYRPKGDTKTQRVTLGKYPALSLSEARRRALTLSQAVSDGTDPQAEAREQYQQMTVRELCDVYIERHAKPNKRTWADDKAMLDRDVVPVIGHIGVGKVVKRDIVRTLDKIEKRGSPIACNRTWEVIRRMFNFAVERSYIEHSPCAGLKARSKEQSRDRVLSSDEIAKLWDRLDNAAMSDEVKDILRLCLTLGQRSGEVAGMRKTELDLQRAIWTLPKSRTKNNMEHIVPLPQMAIKIIQSAKKRAGQSAFIFPSPKKGQTIDSHAVATALRRSMNVLELKNFRTHDLRRTFATGLAELGITDNVTGRLLNHMTGSRNTITSQVYVKHDFMEEKRAAVDLWAARLQDIISGNDKVVPLHKVG